MLATHLNLYKSEKCGASLVIGYAKDKTSAKTCWVVQVKIFLSNIKKWILCKGVEIRKPSSKISQIGSNCGWR